ncbi:MAG: RNA polymerase sigma factor RpoD/SigA [Sphingobacteriia bacterium]|nr:RNA polymerase sigma factor RpoD/SigA [Sphingobacteriia bacterium]
MRQLKIIRQITARDQRSLERYLLEIGRLPRLSPQEEAALAVSARSGDRRAVERLVTANLRFVVSVAKQYQNHGLSLNDLINEGNVGLIKAVHRYDETKGFKFISYAVWWIRQSILQTLADQGRTVRLPTSRMNRIVQIKRLAGRLEQEWGREVHSVELAEQLGLSPEEVDAHLAWALRPTSQDAPSGNGEDESPWSERLEDMNRHHQPGWVLEKESLAQDVDDVLGGLSNREAEILRFSYGIGGRPQLEAEELSNRFQLSRERVRQIRERALRRLRGMAQTNRLRFFLGGT